MAEIRRLIPRPQPQKTEILQTALDLGGWTEPVRLALNDRIKALSERQQPGHGWRWVMVVADRETAKKLLHAIGAGPRPFSTLAVWDALNHSLKEDDGLVLCSQRTLADTAGVALRDVSRALQRLCELGALQALGDGRYRVHPHLKWRGRLAQREKAEALAPRLSRVSVSSQAG